jgi:hypothetical protein
LLEHAARRPDGSYRVFAGRQIPGTIIGNFRYQGTRPDDPNDIVPHEDRRELRALGVFGAWTNVTDFKAENTLDTILTENGHRVVKHYLQDVGSSLGLCNDIHTWDVSWEHFYQGKTMAKRVASFGFALSPWQTVKYTEGPEIGKFEGDRFDPRTWRGHTPNAALMEMRDDDAFWAARRIGAFSDEMIRAIVHTGEFTDPSAEKAIADILIKRRDKILRAYLPAVNPIVTPRLENGQLSFENAAVAADVAKAPEQYRAAWFQFDNATGESRPLGETTSATTTLATPRGLTAGAAVTSWSRSSLTARPTRRGSGRSAPTSVARGTSGRWSGSNAHRTAGRTSPRARCMANRPSAPASAADVGDDILGDRLTLLVNTDEARGSVTVLALPPSRASRPSLPTRTGQTAGHSSTGIPERVTWIR